MKTLKLTVIIVFFSYCGSSQIVIDKSDMPNVNDTIRLSASLTITGDYTITGADHNWDFSDITPVSQQVDTFVSVLSTPLLYQVVFLYPFVSTIASPGIESDQLPGFQITDVFTYYKEANSYFNEVGIAVTINGLPVPLKYDDPDRHYSFPLAYGDTDSSYSSYEAQVAGLGYLGGWKVRKTQVDGWGQLTSPYGTFDVLRLKTDIYKYDSVFIDSLGFGFPYYQEFTEYTWLGKDFGLPLFKVSEQGASPSISYIDSARSISGQSANPVYVRGKVFLQGAYVEPEMTTTLNDNGQLPLLQPFNSPPWNYSGNEEVDSIPGEDIVDWVLLELRDAPDASSATGQTVIDRKAIFLQNNGSFRDLNGLPLVQMDADIQDSLFLVVYHRNHLGVMSSGPLPDFFGIYNYDFTTGAGQAYGGANAHVELLPNVWGMIAADGDADGQIDNSDKNTIWTIQAGGSGYLEGDFNMDTQVDNVDKNDLWIPNSGSGGQIPGSD